MNAFNEFWGGAGVVVVKEVFVTPNTHSLRANNFGLCFIILLNFFFFLPKYVLCVCVCVCVGGGCLRNEIDHALVMLRQCKPQRLKPTRFPANSLIDSFSRRMKVKHDPDDKRQRLTD